MRLSLSILIIAIFFGPLLVNGPAYNSRILEDIFNWDPIVEITETTPDPDARSVVAGVQRNTLKKHITQLSAHPSRVTGYDGAHLAANYIEEQFSSMGLTDVRRESCTLQ